ncbi:DNA cytosine methyltransferase [Streptomyces celluloflavus]|uniref:DNA cytosine methyltransferase n=1 Tax=Streptomyces celluloflavus TaxID=58344 RepID=UPI0036D7B848
MSASGRAGGQLTSIEICAGAGGQAVGLHNAGFRHLALVELDPHAVTTLRANVRRWPGWGKQRAAEIQPMDVKEFLDSPLLEKLGLESGDLDLLAGGVPCPPFSLAGKQLGADDERDLFPEMLRIIKKLRPKAVMIENVRGILEPPHVFIDYRRKIVNQLHKLGYAVPKIDSNWSLEKQNAAMGRIWRRVNARDFGVPQLRPRAVLVAIHRDVTGSADFVWPQRKGDECSVAEALAESMEKRCKEYWDKNQYGAPAVLGERTGKDVFDDWQEAAEKAKSNMTGGVAPTLVGGSKKHGGADLGPTRAKRAWAAMGVDAAGVANDFEKCDPERDLFRKAGPMLTVEQAAIIQGFPGEWEFPGKKTARYRQVGNAFPPPVAEAVGRAIAAVLEPDRRGELLKGYELDDGGVTQVDTESVQAVLFAASIASDSAASGENRSGDLVSAVC